MKFVAQPGQFGQRPLQLEAQIAEGESVQKKNFPQLLVMLVATVGLLYSAVGYGAESEIDHLVQILQIKPGSTVAEVGAGSGEMSIAMARQVGPHGRVYSTEIDPKLVDKIRRRTETEHMANVIPITGKPDNTELPTACCDAIFLRRVYHHLTDPLDMDHSLYQAMRPGSRLAIIDFEPSQLPGRPAPPGVPKDRGGHGVPKKIVAEELTRAGLVLLKTMEWPISPDIQHYCMLFVKPLPRGARTPAPPGRTGFVSQVRLSNPKVLSLVSLAHSAIGALRSS